MLCISPESLNGCSVVFLMMQSARSSRTSTSRRWMTSEKPLPSWAWHGLPPGPGRLARGRVRPTARPRPAGSGQGPVSRPAQAGWLGGASGLPLGPGRLPGWLARVPARPPARPWPAPRPAGSGASPASRPALAGSQAGVPGDLDALGEFDPSSSTSSSPCLSPSMAALSPYSCSSTFPSV